MATDRDAERIVSVRLWLPKENREFEMRVDRDQPVDAVFVGEDVVNQILIPYYEQHDPERAEELRRDVPKQQAKCGFVLVAHMAPCRKQVPDIKRAAASIELRREDWS